MEMYKIDAKFLKKCKNSKMHLKLKIQNKNYIF